MTVDFDRMAANLPADQRKQLSRQYRRGAKNETAAFLSCFFLGVFGVHDMYLGNWGRGLAHLILPVLAAAVLAAGLLGYLPSLPTTIVVAVLLAVDLLWEFADLFQIDRRVRKHNLALAESLIGAGALADSSALQDAVARLDSAVVGAAAGAGAGAPAMSGMITADDVSAARAMAGEQNTAIMEEFDSVTTKYLSDDPNATSPGAPVSWSETTTTLPEPQTADVADMAGAGASPDDTLDMPAPEQVIHTHTETAHSVTDSYEFDRSPDATQPMAIPTVRESEAKTWPDHPPLEEPDVTDHHMYVPQALPVADVEAGGAPQYITLPDEAQAGEPPAAAEAATSLGMGAGIAGAAGLAGLDEAAHQADIPQPQPVVEAETASAAPPYAAFVNEPAAEAPTAGFAPLTVDAATVERDATDAHPHVHHAGLVADLEVNPAQPVYVDLPDQSYVPPVVPLTSAAAGAGAAYLGAQGQEPPQTPSAAPDSAVEAAPTSGPLMKRIRMKRQIVVDGQVIREEVVEKLVPADADTSGLVAEMDSELGHASKEEIAHLANLDPDTSLDVRQRTEMLPHGDEPPAD